MWIRITRNLKRVQLTSHQRLSSSYTTSTYSLEQRIAATQKWFETVVIGEKLCPFAAPFERNPSRLRIVASNPSGPSDVVQVVTSELQMLVNNTTSGSSHETTLIVLDNNVPWLPTFRDFIHLSWQLQQEAIGDEFFESVQIVLFHPQATHQTYGIHDGEDANPADFTIRSPFPTIHLLRQVDVLNAVQSGYPNLESLPARNQQKMIQQGLQACSRRLKECYVNDDLKDVTSW